jgi:hypothetical protein
MRTKFPKPFAMAQVEYVHGPRSNPLHGQDGIVGRPVPGSKST